MFQSSVLLKQTNNGHYLQETFCSPSFHPKCLPLEMALKAESKEDMAVCVVLFNSTDSPFKMST